MAISIKNSLSVLKTRHQKYFSKQAGLEVRNPASSSVLGQILMRRGQDSTGIRPVRERGGQWQIALAPGQSQADQGAMAKSTETQILNSNCNQNGDPFLHEESVLESSLGSISEVKRN